MLRYASLTRQRLVGVFASVAVALSAILVTPGVARADCPTPSWVGVIKTYHNGDYVPYGGQLNSNLPSYQSASDQSRMLYQHSTEGARSNWVIRHHIQYLGDIVLHS